jgi:hypothetical protein
MMSGGVGREADATIGWKDFLMPQKTHKESCRVAASFQLASNSAGGT